MTRLIKMEVYAQCFFCFLISAMQQKQLCVKLFNFYLHEDEQFGTSTERSRQVDKLPGLIKASRKFSDLCLSMSFANILPLRWKLESWLCQKHDFNRNWAFFWSDPHHTQVKVTKNVLLGSYFVCWVSCHSAYN